MCRGWFLACAVDCDRTKPSRHALPVSRMGKRDQPLYRRNRQVWIILVDFFERRTKLGVLNYGVRKNAGAADYRTARYFTNRLNGIPLPYFSCATILPTVSSYLSAPTPSGASAVNTCPHRLHLNRSSSYTVA